MDWGVKTAHLLLRRLQKMSAWYERHSKSMAPFFASTKSKSMQLFTNLKKHPPKPENFNMRSFYNSEFSSYLVLLTYFFSRQCTSLIVFRRVHCLLFLQYIGRSIVVNQSICCIRSRLTPLITVLQCDKVVAISSAAPENEGFACL